MSGGRGEDGRRPAAWVGSVGPRGRRRRRTREDSGGGQCCRRGIDLDGSAAAATAQANWVTVAGRRGEEPPEGGLFRRVNHRPDDDPNAYPRRSGTGPAGPAIPPGCCRHCGRRTFPAIAPEFRLSKKRPRRYTGRVPEGDCLSRGRCRSAHAGKGVWPGSGTRPPRPDDSAALMMASSSCVSAEALDSFSFTRGKGLETCDGTMVCPQ